MDATLAVSESGANHLMQGLIGLASIAKSDSGSWGPFSVGYDVNIHLAGGTVELVDAPSNLIRVHNVNVLGSVGVHFTFDLGAILPTICIPPFQICVDIPFVGRVCTPQVCIPWPPPLTVSLSLPIAVTITSLDFGILVQSNPTTWVIGILVHPFSLAIDLSPEAGAITSAISAAVHSALSSIPLIGDLIADLIDIVLNALTPLLGAILSAISGFINAVLMLLNLFSLTIPVPLLTFDKTQPALPANFPMPGDLEVDINIASLSANILDHELVAAGSIA